MASLASDPNADDIVLDFFAGSGTSGHAVMKLNAEDGGNRRFILVQLPEPAEGAYPTISAITRERVRRAGAAIAKERAGKLVLDGAAPPDLGFRAYKLATSNFRPWDGDPAAIDSVARQVELFVDNLLPDRTPDDILAELILKSGYPLTAPVERIILAGKTVHAVEGGALLLCLERELTLEAIEAMAARQPGLIICLDAAFHNDDQLKVNAIQTIKAQNRGSGQTIEFKVV